MTQDFFLGQLRLILVAAIAFATGKGWLSTDTTTFLGAVMVPAGALLGPWVWSIYTNVNRKLVPSDSVAVSAENVVNKNAATAVGSTALITSSDNNPTTVPVKVVG